MGKIGDYISDMMDYRAIEEANQRQLEYQKLRCAPKTPPTRPPVRKPMPEYEAPARVYMERNKLLIRQNQALVQENEKLRETLSQVKSGQDALVGETDELKSEIAKLKTKLSETRLTDSERLAPYVNELTKLTDQNSHLTSQNEALEQQLNSTTLRFERLTENHRALIRQHNKAVDNLMRHIEARDNYIIDMATERDDYEDAFRSQTDILEAALALLDEHGIEHNIKPIMIVDWKCDSEKRKRINEEREIKVESQEDKSLEAYEQTETVVPVEKTLSEPACSMPAPIMAPIEPKSAPQTPEFG